MKTNPTTATMTPTKNARKDRRLASPALCKKIRDRYGSPPTLNQVAKEAGLSPRTVWAIIHRKYPYDK